MADPRKHHTDQTEITRLAGCPTRAFCAAVSAARALAGGHGAKLGAVALWLHRIRKLWSEDEKAGRQWDDTSGSWFGHLKPGWDALGLAGELEQLKLDHSKTALSQDRWTGRYRHLHRQGYPTMAQWERSHRHVKRAIIRGTGHVGYFERDADGVAHIYNMGARKRVDYALILETT